jgi:hypothetical protein
MKKYLWISCLVLAALPALSCGSGGECDTCSADSDCNSGRLCVKFDDGSMRCGSGQGTTQCRVR